MDKLLVVTLYYIIRKFFKIRRKYLVYSQNDRESKSVVQDKSFFPPIYVNKISKCEEKLILLIKLNLISYIIYINKF